MSGYGKQIVVTSAIAAVLVIGIGFGLYYTTTINNYSVQGGGDQTVAASYVSTFTEITSTSTDHTISGGEYSYSPNSPVKILEVQAFTSQGGSGKQSLSFSVEFQNVGSSTIYVVSGGSTSLNATILSGPARSETSFSAKCEIVTAQIPVGPGDNFTSSTPSCGSGYTYTLLQPGTIRIELTLSWSQGSSTSGSSGGATEIMSEFTLN